MPDRTWTPAANWTLGIERSEHRLYAHLVWPTLSDLSIPGRHRRAVVERHLISLCRRLNTEPLSVVATSDRVQLLVRYPPTCTLSSLVSRLKSGSREALRSSGLGVEWSRGYAITSIGSSDVRSVMRRLLALSEPSVL